MRLLSFSMFFYPLLVGLFAGITLTANFQRGQKWQIILSAVPDIKKSPLPPTDAIVWDIDMFDADSTTIATLKAQGKIVICYFSAGTFEPWRDDASKFNNADKGKALPDWPDEKWLKTGSSSVRSIMTSRIQLAASKGCDAIDPDNMDGYQNDNGLNLKSSDAVDYMNFLSTTASGLGMQTGLKNALDIIPNVQSMVAFAVNEQCANLSECTAYDEFLASGKPVFHIEYPTGTKLPSVTANDNKTDCGGAGTSGMSTVLKELSLSGLVVYCDGSQADTPVVGGNPSNPHRSPTARPTPTRSRTTTSRRPSSTPPPRPTTSRTTTTPPTSNPNPPTSNPNPPPPSGPTSTSNPGGGSGCKSKHWDQCGGNNWKGCTVCESPYTCKGVSPPYYYQCL